MQPGRAIFGIVQGGTEKDLRLFSAQALVDTGFHGYAIGGLAVGEPQAAMLDMIDIVVPHLPSDRPRYLMGVGTPDDLLQSLRRGVDMFDCVLPTRAGRHGLVFTRRGRLNLRNARFADDPRPVDPLSSSPMARDYSRAYWRHLAKSGEILAMMGLTEINLAYYQDLMSGARQAIAEGRLDAYITEAQRNWAEGEAEGALTRVSARQGRHTIFAGPAKSNSCANVLTRQRRSAPGRSVHRQNTKGRDAFPAARPFFRPCVAFRKSRLFCFILPSVTCGGSRLSNALSSHRPYGVRRQTFWQRPPFGVPLLVQISGCVTSLGGPAMHIFSGLVDFGQLCSGECKSAVRLAVILGSRPPFIVPRDDVINGPMLRQWRKNDRNRERRRPRNSR